MLLALAKIKAFVFLKAIGTNLALTLNYSCFVREPGQHGPKIILNLHPNQFGQTGTNSVISPNQILKSNSNQITNKNFRKTICQYQLHSLISALFYLTPNQAHWFSLLAQFWRTTVRHISSKGAKQFSFSSTSRLQNRTITMHLIINNAGSFECTSQAMILLSFSIIAWGGALKTTLPPLFITQKYILTAPFNKRRRYHTDRLFQEMFILSTLKLFIKHLLICHCHTTKTLSTYLLP